jgi:glycosyltransferase involved in cell wall biosynthesis
VVVLVHLPQGGHRERRVLEAAAAVVTTSAWTHDVLLEAGSLDPAAVYVATPGAPRAALATATGAGSRLVCVAAVTPVKGHGLLVAALATVRHLDWQCVCVGSLNLAPQHVTDVRAQVRAAGLADRVRFVGPLPEDELDRVYAASDLLVLSSRLETYGMVVTEALARGTPVVATAVGGVGEALGWTTAGSPGRLVPGGDPKALGAALRSWLTDRGVRASWRAAARERRATLPPWDATVRSVASALAGEPLARKARLPSARPTTRGR